MCNEPKKYKKALDILGSLSYNNKCKLQKATISLSPSRNIRLRQGYI